MTDIQLERISLSLDWSEIDVFGHINNVAFFKYLQAARVHFWERMGLLSKGLPADPGPMLAQSQCRFLKPLYFPGHIVIATGVKLYKTNSFVLSHGVYNSDKHLCASGEDVCVCYDFNNNSKSALNDEQRHFLQHFKLPENFEF